MNEDETFKQLAVGHLLNRYNELVRKIGMHNRTGNLVINLSPKEWDELNSISGKILDFDMKNNV